MYACFKYIPPLLSAGREFLLLISKNFLCYQLQGGKVRFRIDCAGLTNLSAETAEGNATQRNSLSVVDALEFSIVFASVFPLR